MESKMTREKTPRRFQGVGNNNSLSITTSSDQSPSHNNNVVNSLACRS